MHARTGRRPSSAQRLQLMTATAAALIAGLLCAITGTDAQPASYPTKPVRLIVPYGPGGVGDLTMRLLADKLDKQLHRRFVIENRPGAGGIVAMTEVLRAPPDGYMLGEMGNGQAISMSLFNKLPYNVLTDFSQISVAASFEMLLAVPDRSPYKSLKDILDAARKNPGKLNLGAISPGASQNLSAHVFEQVTGAKFTLVAYRTTPDLVTALLRGDVAMGFDFYAALHPMIGPGRIRIIATSGEKRDPLLPNVPTVKEDGYPSYIVTSWNGIAARAGVPKSFVDLLSMIITEALASPDIQAKARTLGIDARGSTPEQMHERMAADIAKWRAVIEKSGIPKQ